MMEVGDEVVKVLRASHDMKCVSNLIGKLHSLELYRLFKSKHENYGFIRLL